MKRVSVVVVVFSSDKLFIQFFLFQKVLILASIISVSSNLKVCSTCQFWMKSSLYTVSVNGLVNSFLASGDFVVC